MGGLRIVNSMVGARRIEMSTGGLEVRRNAAGRLMEVDGMLARRKALEREMEPDTILVLPDGNSPKAFTACIGKRHDHFGGLFGVGSGAHQDNRE
jgi:hypothetical protein